MEKLERTTPRSMSARPSLPPPPSSASSLTPLTRSHSDCDIVKRGSLYVKHPPSVFPTSLSIQPWKRRYVILRDTWRAPAATTTLDIYDSEPRNSSSSDGGFDCQSPASANSSSSPLSGWRSGTPYSVDLRDVTAVGLHLESRRFQFAFYVQRRDDRSLVFAAESDLDVRCWVAALKTLANKAQCSNGVGSSTVDGVISLPNRARNVSRLPTTPDVHGGRPAPVRLQVIGSAGSQRLAVVDQQLRQSAPQLDSIRLLVQQKSKKHSVEEFSRRRSSSRDELATAKCAVRHERFPSTPEDSAVSSNNNSSSSSCPEHHPLRRLFSASIFGRASGRWRTFSKSLRKDSGFSDSFDDSTISSVVSTGSIATTSTGGSSSSTVSTPDSAAPDASVDFPSDASDEAAAGNSSRFGPPPKLPPRRATTSGDDPWMSSASSSPVLLRPPPPPRPTPPPVERPVERRGNVERPGVDVPPLPPPRPAYTLTHFSTSTRRTIVH